MLHWVISSHFKACFIIFGQIFLLRISDGSQNLSSFDQSAESHKNITEYKAESNIHNASHTHPRFHSRKKISLPSGSSTEDIKRVPDNLPVVTRFAPSPTGFLHIGSARTALFNYLFARHHNGKFLLRIEDTNRERSTEEAVEAIFAELKWLGIQWDEEPIFQSKRNDLYKNAAHKLLKEGKAYYCFTPQDEIENQKQIAMKNEQHFTSEWRDRDPSTYPKDVKPVIRLKTPNKGHTIVHDTIQGDIFVKNSQIDDMVLLRADCTATYMLAVVVDDHEMGITHIIRGADHLTNAARQLAIYKALGYEVPSMTHVPLIFGVGGAKISKRHGALGIEAYKDMGYLPESLCNYLLRLGWSHGNDEIISMEQAIKWFSLESLGKSPAHLDFTRLNSLNAHYLRQVENDTLTSRAVEILKKNYTVTEREISFIRRAIPSLAVRCETLLDVVRLAQMYLTSSPIIYEKDAQEIINNCDKELIKQVVEDLSKLEPFDKESVQNKFKEIASHNGLKLNEVMRPVRALVTGKTNSPGVFEMAEIIGKENILKRLKLK